MPARPGPRPHLGTIELLQAVSTRGRFWTAAFADEEVRTINEAVDRELFDGNLTNAHTLSAQGEQVLEDHLGHPNDQATIDLRADYACREHSACWTISCVRCTTTQLEHVLEAAIEDRIQQVIAGHICVGGHVLSAPSVDQLV